jgi:DSF synthase
VRILHRNFRSLDLPIVTIGLVEGDALGGGFEALLSFDMIVAERGAKFGLPESMFGLFPGMGAHSFLSRKLGSAMAERMIMGGETYSAEQLYDLGLVHTLFDKGMAKPTVDKLIKNERRRFNGLLGANRAMTRANNISLQELEDIVDHWADSALKLSEQNIRLMQRLVGAQTKLCEKTLAQQILAQPNAIDIGSEKSGSPEDTKRVA